MQRMEDQVGKDLGEGVRRIEGLAKSAKILREKVILWRGEALSYQEMYEESLLKIESLQNRPPHSNMNSGLCAVNENERDKLEIGSALNLARIHETINQMTQDDHSDTYSSEKSDDPEGVMLIENNDQIISQLISRNQSKG